MDLTIKVFGIAFFFTIIEIKYVLFSANINIVSRCVKKLIILIIDNMLT